MVIFNEMYPDLSSVSRWVQCLVMLSAQGHPLNHALTPQGGGPTHQRFTLLPRPTSCAILAAFMSFLFACNTSVAASTVAAVETWFMCCPCEAAVATFPDRAERQHQQD